MPNCAAGNCRNSSKKGFYLTRFPRNSERRKEWELAVRNEGWQSTEHSYLCEAHFPLNQWIMLPSGKRKLKRDALPSKENRLENNENSRDQSSFKKRKVLEDLSNKILEASSTTMVSQNIVDATSSGKNSDEGAPSSPIRATTGVEQQLLRSHDNVLPIESPATLITTQVTNSDHGYSARDKLSMNAVTAVSIIESTNEANKQQNKHNSSNEVSYNSKSLHNSTPSSSLLPDMLSKARISEHEYSASSTCFSENIKPSSTKIVKLTKDWDSTHSDFEKLKKSSTGKLILLTSSTHGKNASAFKQNIHPSTFSEVVTKFKMNISTSMSKHTDNKFKEMQKELEEKDKRILQLESKLKQSQQMVSKLFNPDQVKMLTEGHHIGEKWSHETVQKSLKIKFACGPTGYNCLLDEGYPLPSIRTLTRRIEHVKFEPGILHEVFEFLKEKVISMEPQDKLCNLVIDEVAVVEGVLYDPSSKKIIGYVTLPDDSDIRATKALVMLLSGLRARWKQVVAYFFTTPSLNGALLKPIILDVVQLAANVGLSVLNFVSDMGPENLQIWKSFGICCGRYSILVNKVTHPSLTGKFLTFMPDTVHAFKNFRSALENNEVVMLPENVCEENRLSSRYVSYKHLDEIIALEPHVIKMAHDAAKTKLHPNSFEKMKVLTSKNVINEDTAAALEFWADELSKPEYKTTAFFIRQVSRWYKLMNSNNRIFALSFRNREKYDEAVTFLRNFITMIEHTQIGNMWKPIQTAVKLATTSILELSHYLLTDEEYEYVFTSHMNSNCIENIFSVVKSKHPIPNCLQFKQDLKNLSISQFMRVVTTSSYDYENRDFLTSLFDARDHVRIPNSDTRKTVIYEQSNFKVVDTSTVEYTNGHLNALYCIFGHVIFKLKHRKNTCDNCFESLTCSKPLYRHYTQYTRLKEFKENSLVFITPKTFRFMLELESIFMKCETMLQSVNDCENFLIWQFKENTLVSEYQAPSCHNIKSMILEKFASFRLKLNNQKSREVVKSALNQVPASTGSKSMAMRCYVNRQKK